ncbi:hypothetical protein Fmac_016234 [Flemingia macrophylla]|uniref:Uncharacterized protein n=1 Tax=Flemingia macrophylla TaxID=520843 RepID=A0ABD1MGT8_9FABA
MYIHPRDINRQARTLLFGDPLIIRFNIRQPYGIIGIPILFSPILPHLKLEIIFDIYKCI